MLSMNAASTSFEVRRFSLADSDAWNSFVSRARNGHFMFDRRYMDYHNDTFDDFSLTIHRNDHLVAVLPTNRVAGDALSHAGLTFGGFVIADDIRASAILEVFHEVIDYLKANACRSLLYKCVPHIYHRQPAEEDLYALAKLNAQLVRREISCALDLSYPSPMTKGRKASVRKALREGTVIVESVDFEQFMAILSQRLRDKYDARATHTAAELQLLAKRFPRNIKLMAAMKNEEMIAGAVIYQSGHVVHTQYLGSTETGRNIGALDALIAELIEKYREEARYLDFGTSTTVDGSTFNETLLFYKEAFGARAVMQDQYLVDIG